MLRILVNCMGLYVFPPLPHLDKQPHTCITSHFHRQPSTRPPGYERPPQRWDHQTIQRNNLPRWGALEKEHTNINNASQSLKNHSIEPVILILYSPFPVLVDGFVECVWSNDLLFGLIGWSALHWPSK